MNTVEKCKVLALCPGTSTTSATALHSIDTIGCSKVHVYVLNGTQTTTSQCWADISIYQGTNSSATTLIPSASWATEATTAALNALPSAALAGPAGSVVEINIDMRDKERYLNILTTRGATPTAASRGALFVLLEPNISADTTTKKQQKDLQDNTNVQSVAIANA